MSDYLMAMMDRRMDANEQAWDELEEFRAKNARLDSENAELRRIVRWCMRHAGVELPDDMQASFNKISGV